jgi:hypothetical protein
MGHLAGTTFGIGTPTTFPGSASPWGFSPYTGQAPGTQPFLQQQQQYGQPFSNQSIAGFGIGAAQPLQQILQVLQIVPQQLQQLHVLQQQQLIQLQQLLQLIPAQLQQLQQLIQIAPHQALGSAISNPVGFGLVPQTFAGQGANYVM